CQAHYLSRLIIGFEIAIGIAILQNHFLKRLVIPATILLLVAFCIHLSIQMVQFGPMNGNCGCFGQLIPMTPLEAFIKNILTIGMLIYLYKNVTEKEKDENKFIYLLCIYSLSTLLMFIGFPFCPCDKTEAQPVVTSFQLETDSTKVYNKLDTDTVVATQVDTSHAAKIESKKDTASIKVIENAPKKVASKFTKFNHFGNLDIDLNSGKKIVCMFAPGCDHCRETAKEIGKLAKAKKFPEVYIIFMDEEANLIPEFFKIAEVTYPYQVLNIPSFWDLLGSGMNTPGVFYLWNGNILYTSEGIEKNKFESSALKKAVESKK
ncbi:MAG: protein tlpB, partial [Bacteroidetes bacterium]|nr:protein tlpB [Bacteroidota bacterium]